MFLEILSLILCFVLTTISKGFIQFSQSNKREIVYFREAVSGFFALRENNTELLRINSEMELKIARLEESLRKAGLEEEQLKAAGSYEFIHARVIKNSVSQLRNYLTLNVGKLDGVAEGMGVCNHLGIVGVVSVCSDHFSVVIPVLNPGSVSAVLFPAAIVWVFSLTGKEGDTRFAWLEESARLRFLGCRRYGGN